ncbi:hypothetical protein MSG28_012337 [Choristoneura fumiferana]|uniref:Uncharacterized protein n=1 Tax=Choristoneura fumiferana TaxID=7141 RepID=A0ACC0KCP0_CHOFU|nr:hypothetical protein MSG28_012337 [Choristoneura fumiferana]
MKLVEVLEWGLVTSHRAKASHSVTSGGTLTGYYLHIFFLIDKGVPVYKESAYTARTIQDRGDSNYTKITGPTNFAPYYPTYAAVQPPPLPQ